MPGQITMATLAHFLDLEERIIWEGTKLVLPVSLLRRINSELQQTDSALSEPTDELCFLQKFLSQIPKMKVSHHANGSLSMVEEVDITRFANLRYLEIEHVPIHLVKGLQALRPQLEFLSCYRCPGTYEDIFVGGEGNSLQVWEELRTVSLSGDKIEVIGARTFTSTPWLQYLDLSNNNITDHQWSLETLNNLKHLNLSYNHIDSLPKLSEESCQKLEVLLLRHNYIDDLSEIWQFKCLEQLDVSNNLLDDCSTMSALMELNDLENLNLEGNPISYHQNYRLHVCSCLSKKHGVTGKAILLDNKKLNKKEINLLGTRRGGVYSHSRSQSRRPLLRSEDEISNEAGVSRLSERSTGSCCKSLSGKKMPRIREAIIVNADMVADSGGDKGNAPVTPVKEGPPPEHLETKKQLEDLRQRFGENQWLHSHAGSFVQDLLGLQKTPNLTSQVLLQHSSGVSPVDLDYGEVERSLLNVTGNSSEMFFTPCSTVANTTYTSLLDSDRSAYDNTLVPTQLSYADGDVQQSEERKQEKEETWKDEDSGLEGNDSDEPEDDDDGDPWLVQRVVSEDKLQEVFLLLKETELKEKDPLSGHTLTRWGLSTVESCVKLAAQPPTVQIIFDTIRKLCKERTYVMEADDAQELLQRLGHVLESRPISEMNQAVFRCMKCSTIFSRELKATIYTPKDGGLAHCQACGSNLCIQINEDEQFPSNGKSKGGTDSKLSASPETKMGTSPSQCSIGSAASLDQSSRESPAGPGEGSHGQSQTATPRRCDSDIEVISNPSQSSIEVIEVQARLQAAGSSGTGTPNRKRSSEERQTVAVPQLVTVPEVQSGNTGLTESSSSGSLTDSICTTYENHAPLGRRLPSQGSTGVTLLEETSAENSPSAAASVPCPPQPSDGGERSPLKSFHSLPNSNYANILENLLQNVSSKLEYPKQSNRSPHDDSVQYTYDDLSLVDHRIKLFLYQGLFENEEEHLVLLIRATVVDKEGQTYPGCFVVSTCNCFILKVIGKESGDDASEFLQKEYAQALSKMQSVTALPWLQGISVEFQAHQFLLLIHDAERTRHLFDFIKGVRSSLPETCTVADISGSEDADRHSLAIQHELLTSSSPGSLNSSDVDASLTHVSLAVTVTITRDDVVDEILPFTCFGVTGSDLFLLKSNLRWMFRSSNIKPALHVKERMSNLIDISMSGTTLTLHFLDENEGVEETWLLSYPTPTSVTAIIEAIRTPWELLFSVPLQITTVEN